MVAVHQPPPIFAPLARPHELPNEPAGFQEHFERAVKLYEDGRYDEALLAFKAAARLRPNEPEAHYGCGVALAHIGRERYEEALEAFQKAIALLPNLPKAYSALGVVLGLLGRNEESLDAFDQALKLRPDDAWSHAEFGMTLAVLGRHKEALAELDQAIRLQPAKVRIRAARGSILRWLLGDLVTGGEKAWLGSKPRGSAPPIVLKPGPSVSDAIIEERR